jgi:hypothetical protein
MKSEVKFRITKTSPILAKVFIIALTVTFVIGTVNAQTKQTLQRQQVAEQRQEAEQRRQKAEQRLWERGQSADNGVVLYAN